MSSNLILGIESSCDETAASVTLNGRTVLSDVIYSQADIHKIYGGVVPEIASRNHIKSISYVIDESLNRAGIKKEDLSAIAVTNGPGLIGALLVGVSAAKGLAYSLSKPLVAVNHIHGHIAANYIAHTNLEPPFLCLIASGGHSHILNVQEYGKFEILGATLDDAAGEAFDKVARVIGLGYPGGPKVSALAQQGDSSKISFPKPLNGCDFSFSGVKTAVINYIHKLEQNREEIPTADIAASFQAAVVDVLTGAVENAIRAKGAKKIALAGGVASNTALRESLSALAQRYEADFFVPPPNLCTDNGAMISCAGYYNYISGATAPLNLNAYATLRL